MIDYKNLCENYSKEVGCYNTFDGSCIKEKCFTYKLLQQCERLKIYNNFDVESLQGTNKALLDEITFLNNKIDELKTEIDELKQQQTCCEEGVFDMLGY